MIDGITILNTTEITTLTDYGVLWVILNSLLLVTQVSLACIYYEKNKKKFWWHFIFSVFMCIWTVCCAYMSSYTYNKYEVTIDDSVILTEFNQKYEVIEQRGDIYVINDKEINND